MDFEELVLDDVELEALSKEKHSFQFPIVSVNKENIYFNSYAKELVPRYVNWFATPEYIIGLPANEDDNNAYKASHHKDSAITAIPYRLKQKKLRSGKYAVYKYKDGFAFKRYEPLVPNEEDG